MPLPEMERRDQRPPDSEVRFGDIVEIRQEGDGAPVITGYAAVFNSMSEDLGGFRETIAPGAFADSLAEDPDVFLNIQHQGGLTTVARTRNGTLKLTEDDRGLLYEGTVAPTQAGRDIVELIRRGDISKSSFAFRVRQNGEAWDFTEDPAIRTLTAVDLFDVAPVDVPAYKATSVSVRDGAKDVYTAAQVAAHREQLRQIEEVRERAYRYRWGLDKADRAV